MECVFCRELNGSRDTNFAKRYPEIPSRIVGESSSLAAFPCIGQLSPGHFLIVPKHHDATFRESAIRIPDLQLQIQALARHVHVLLDADERNSLYFEHGAGCVADGGCGIYHAHIHVIPNAGHIDVAQHFPAAYKSQSRHAYDAWTTMQSGGPYVLFGSSTQGFFVHHLDGALPSQTLRRVVASELNVKVWNWREVDREVEMLRVLQKAASL